MKVCNPGFFNGVVVFFRVEMFVAIEVAEKTGWGLQKEARRMESLVDTYERNALRDESVGRLQLLFSTFGANKF